MPLHFPLEEGREKMRLKEPGRQKGGYNYEEFLPVDEALSGVPFSILLCVHRDHKDYQGRGAQDGHFDVRTVLSSVDTRSFSVALRSQRPHGLSETGQDVHFDFHTAPELCAVLLLITFI